MTTPATRAELEQRETITRLEARIADVRDLHRRAPIYPECPSNGCEDDNCTEWTSFDEFVHTGEVVRWACGECRDEDGDLVDWPCPTIQTLDEGADHE